MTLVSKFILLFVLARILDPAEVGLYGLLAVTISYALYFLGFDFYTFTAREIVKHKQGEWGGLLKSQCAFSMILYATFLPLFALLFVMDVLPGYLFAWFIILVILEHVNQELGRLLVVISRPFVASWVLFLRAGLWTILVIPLLYLVEDARNLITILAAWSIGGVAAAFLGTFMLWRMGLGGWDKAVDWAWIKRGVTIAVPFLIATLALRGVYTVDRYWFEYLVGLDVLAAYVLFMGIANALMSFLDAGVFAFLYPALIKKWQGQSPIDFRKELLRMLVQTLGFSAVFIITAQLSIPYMLDWLERPLYSEYASLFGWLMLATLLFALSMVPHFALYAQGQDRSIISSHVLSIPVFIGCTLLLSFVTPLLAVPLGLCLSSAFLLSWKMVAYLRLTPKTFQLFR